MEQKPKTNRKLNIVASAIVCFAGIVAIALLEYAAIHRGLDGIGLASSIGAVLGIVLAFTGVKIKDVLSGK